MKTKIALVIIFVLTAIATLAWLTDTAKSQFAVTKGLVSYWTFDEVDTKEAIVKDVLGKNNGTAVGNPKIVEGKLNKCLSFDGVDDCVKVGDDPSLNFKGGEFSVEAWVRLDAWVAQKEFAIAKKAVGYENTPGWLVMASAWGRPEKKVGFYFAITNAAWGDNCFKSTDYDTGQWYHVVATRSGKEGKLYIDGVLSGQKTADALSRDVDNDDDMYIGKAYPGSLYWNGLIDEVRIYNRALSMDEVKQNLVAKGLASVTPNEKLAFTWAKIKVSR